MRALPLTVCLMMVLPALASGQTWHCFGTEPNWTLWFDEAQGEFTYPSVTQMDVMQESRAENRDWPLAVTLIGARDTAIVLVEPLACRSIADQLPYRALVLTQRGQTPILLTGCCEAPR